MLVVPSLVFSVTRHVLNAWMMRHRYRSVMVRPDRDTLHGDVEVDETICGRVRPSAIPDASTTSLAAFFDANVEPGSNVITDGWSA